MLNPHDKSELIKSGYRFSKEKGVLRLAFPFLSWTSKENILKITKNLYEYIDKYSNPTLTKERTGSIYDKTGHTTFRKEILKNIDLNSFAIEHTPMTKLD